MWQIISEYIGLLIMMVGVYIFGRVVLEKKDTSNLLKDIILILLFTIPQTIVKLNFDETIKTIFMGVIYTVFFRRIFNLDYKKSVFLTFLSITLMIIPELIEIFFLTKLLNLNMDFC